MIRRRRLPLQLLLAALLILSISSCDPSKKYIKEENGKVQDYLINNPGLNFVSQSSGLYYLEIETGTGRMPVKSDTVYVMYTGRFLDGQAFDSNVESKDTLIFPAAEGWMIAGFDEGVTLMKEHGKAVLLVPSKLGYGASGYYIIPGYTPLLYEVELVKVIPGPGK